MNVRSLRHRRNQQRRVTFDIKLVGYLVLQKDVVADLVAEAPAVEGLNDVARHHTGCGCEGGNARENIL